MVIVLPCITHEMATQITQFGTVAPCRCLESYSGLHTAVLGHWQAPRLARAYYNMVVLSPRWLLESS